MDLIEINRYLKKVLPILHNNPVKKQSDKSPVFFVFLGKKIHNKKVLDNG
jgi:hypothetical protein